METLKCGTPLMRQCAVNIGVFLTKSSVDMTFSFLAIMLMQFSEPSSTLVFNDTEISWIVTIAEIGNILGNFIFSLIIGRLGRKRGHLAINAINLIAFTFLASASSLTAILIARFLQGLSLSLTIPSVPIMISEYSSPKHRGVLITASMMFSSVVSLVVMTAGLHFHWNMVAGGCAVYQLVDLFLVTLTPESPTWLIERGRYAEAKKIFQWLREPSEGDELQNMIKANLAHKPTQVTGDYKTSALTVWSKIRQREFYYPIIVMLHLFLIFSWSGFICIVVYMADTIKMVMNGDEHMAIIMSTIGIQSFVSSILATYITKLCSRKRLLASVICLHIAVMLILAGYVQLRNMHWMPFDHPSIGIILIHLHYLTITIGPDHMLLVFGGEIFPVEFRSLATSVAYLLATPNTLLSVRSEPFLMRTSGFPASYLLFASLVSYGLIVAYNMVPETRDKTLYDIEQEIKGKQMKTCEVTDSQMKQLQGSETRA